MANKKFLLENNLMDAYKNFMHLASINENMVFQSMEEDEDSENPNDGSEDGQDPMSGGPGGGSDPMGGGPGGDPMGGQGGPDPMGGGPGGDPMGGPGDGPGGPGGDPMGGGPGDDPMGGDPMGGGPMDNPMGGPGGDPMGGAPSGDPLGPDGEEVDEEEDEEEEEDDVIDVDDITNAQEKTNVKVNKVGRNLGKVDDKIKDIMKLINNLQSMIDNNNAKISEFKREFERRNPTPVEKMNLRSLDSFPFNQNPTKYWEKKGTQPDFSGNRYEAYANNAEPVANKEYVITQNDVEDFDDGKIKNSFHIDDELRSTLEKIFEI